MKKLTKMLLIIVVTVVVLVLGKNLIIKAAVEGGVQIATGLRLNIQSFSLSLLKGSVDIRGLKLFNPRGFKDKVMVDIPEILVDLDPQSLFQGKLHLEEMRFTMKELVVVKNANAALNLDALKPVQNQKKGKAAPTTKKQTAPKMQVDRLHLKVEKVVFKDYSKGGEPQVKEFNIGLDEHHENIPSLELLIGVIITKTLMRTTIASLTNFDVSGLSDSVTHSLKSVQTLAPELTSKAQGVLNQGVSQAPGLAKETTEAMKTKAENLKNRLQKLF